MAKIDHILPPSKNYLRVSLLSRMLTLGVFLAIVTAQGQVKADSGIGSQALPELGTSVVAAARYEQQVESVPAHVTIITEADIARSTAKNVPEILQEVGFNIHDVTGSGWGYSLNRSGFGASSNANILMLVNGQRATTPDPFEWVLDWTLVPLNHVARIEIVRGSRGNVLYGDNATDGVINIITKGGTPDFKFGVESAGGSYGTLNHNAYVSGTYRDISYAVAGHYYKSNGYRNNNNHSKQGNISLNLDYALGEIAHIGLSAGHHRNDIEWPGVILLSHLAAGRDRRDSVTPLGLSNNTNYYVQLNPEVYFLENSFFRIPISYRERDHDYFIDSDSCGTCRYDNDTHDIAASPQLIVKEAIGRFSNSLTLGFDYSRSEKHLNRRTLGISLDQYKLKRNNYSLYIHDEFSVTDKLTLSAGYRWDQTDQKFFTTSTYYSGSLGSVDYDEQVFSTGLNYRFLDRSHVYFSFAQGFRYPTLGEPINALFNHEFNEDLKPQTTDNYEIGIRHYFTDNLYGSLNLFRLDTNDEIYYRYYDTGTNDNLDSQTRREGVEVAAGFDSRRISLRGNYTYRDTKIRGATLAGNEIQDVPRHQAGLDLVWRPVEGLSLALNGVHVGARYLDGDHTSTLDKLDDYQVFNLKVKYTWQKYTAFLDLNNVFNEKYSTYGYICVPGVTDVAFLPAPEFNLFAGLRFDY